MLRKKILPLYLIIILITNSFCYQKNCGMEGGSKARISGGLETRPHQYPWMVYFEFRNHGDGPDSGANVCGGSLISDRLVLTAKHCVEKAKEYRRARAAIHNLEDHYESVPLEFEKKLLPDYHHGENCYDGDRDINCNDIAIIVLKTPVDLNDSRIGVVCLPEDDRESYFGEWALAMGWGMVKYDFLNEKGVWEHELKEVYLTIAEKSSEFNLFTYVDKNNKGVYKDPCPGDSGGPLLVEIEGAWHVIGTVLGNGYDCENDEVNGDGTWTKVTANLKWIKKIMDRYGKEKKGYYNRGFRYNRRIYQN